MSIKEIIVVFIGRLSKKRSEMQEEAREFGLTVNNSISIRTDFLVSGDHIAPSAHVERAQKYGITVISEKEYRELLPLLEAGIKLLKLIFSEDLSDVQQGLMLLKTKQAHLPTSQTPVSIRTQHLFSLQTSLLSNIEYLRLVGEPKEPKPKFSDLLLETEQDERSYGEWRTQEADNRAHYSISEHNFLNLNRLSIQDDAIVGQIDISNPKIESILIKNLPSLTTLKIRTPCKKLVIQDCPNLVEMHINTENLNYYRLSPALKNGISEAVSLSSQEQIAEHFTKQKEQFVEIVDDSVYGYTFTGKHAHIDHHEVWVEMYYYECSFPFLIDFLKYSFDPKNKQELYKHPLRSDSRVKLFSEEFDLDMDCTISCGYNLDYYELAKWKNRATSVDPQFTYYGKSYDHDTESEDYQILIEPIRRAFNIYYLPESVLSWCSPELIKELAEVYRKFHPED